MSGDKTSIEKVYNNIQLNENDVLINLPCGLYKYNMVTQDKSGLIKFMQKKYKFSQTKLILFAYETK